MRTHFQGVLAAAALFIAHPASAQVVPPAQTPPAAEGPDIVVTGARTTEEEMKAFVDALTIAPSARQLSRFRQGVCPAVAGVPAAQKAVVAQRLRAVAKAAGMDVAPAKCVSNILVMVTSNRPVLMQTLMRRRPTYLSSLSGEERRRLLASTEPAIAWHIAGPPITAEGADIPVDLGSGIAINRTTRNPSRIAFATRPQFAAAFVVIDAAALAGLTTTQLADYAAMRAFIRTDPAGLADSRAPTILKALDTPMGEEVPLTLTRWDIGVLRGFYASDPALTAAAQRSAIRRELDDDLQKDDRRRQ